MLVEWNSVAQMPFARQEIILHIAHALKGIQEMLMLHATQVSFMSKWDKFH